MDYRPTWRQGLRVFLALIFLFTALSMNADIYPMDYANDTLIAGGNVYNGDCLRREKLVCYTTWKVMGFDTGFALVTYYPIMLDGRGRDPDTLDDIREIWREENDFKGVFS